MSWDWGGGEVFASRREAGRLLAQALEGYAGQKDIVVLALPRGGVPVGYEVALLLKAPLDVLVVRKLGVPGEEELAMGAIGPGGVRVLNQMVVSWVSEEEIEMVTERERKEVQRRDRQYRGDKARVRVEGKTVIVVDDGLATGSSMRAAVAVLREQQPKVVVVAVPVGAKSTCRELKRVADSVVCLREVERLGAVGMWYVDFEQTTDEEVMELLKAPLEEQLRQATTQGD